MRNDRRRAGRKSGFEHKVVRFVTRVYNEQTRAQEIADARKAIGTRSDNPAMFAWCLIMPYLGGDPGLREVVDRLRALNLYQQEYWVETVSKGYELLHDKEGFTQLVAEVAKRHPDLVESTGIRCSGCAAEVAKIMDRIAQSPGSGARK